MKDGPGDVSHGICGRCEKKFNEQLAASKKKRSKWQEAKLFWQFMTGRHYIVRQREVLI
jgi:hypothetical protein